MKRLLPALLLTATTLLGTVACGDDSDSGDSNPSDTEVETPAPVPT